MQTAVLGGRRSSRLSSSSPSCVENWVSGNVPRVVDFAGKKVPVLGADCLRRREMEAPTAAEASLGVELARFCGGEFPGSGSRCVREGKARMCPSSPNLLRSLTLPPSLLQDQLFQWCSSLRRLLVTSHLRATRRREGRGPWSRPSPKWTTALGKASGLRAPCSLLSGPRPLLLKHMKPTLIMDSYALNTKLETSRKRR